jgi:hypothetical protein
MRNPVSPLAAAWTLFFAAAFFLYSDCQKAYAHWRGLHGLYTRRMVIGRIDPALG